MVVKLVIAVGSKSGSDKCASPWSKCGAMDDAMVVVPVVVPVVAAMELWVVLLLLLLLLLLVTLSSSLCGTCHCLCMQTQSNSLHS